jgi:preprotein translocase subunit SecE
LALVLILWVLAIIVIACWVVDGLKSDLQKDKLQNLWCYLQVLCRSYVGWTLVHQVLWLFTIVLFFLVLAIMVIACWAVDGLKSDLQKTSFKIYGVICWSYVGWTLVHQVLWFFGQWLALVLIFWVLAIMVIACWVVDGLKSDLQKTSFKHSFIKSIGIWT